MTDSLQQACELAFEVARDRAEADPATEPPDSMRSFLYVSDLPRRAIAAARQVIEDDAEFRSKVASRASENEVGRAGYLWLHRPEGWGSEFEQLADTPAFGAVSNGGAAPPADTTTDKSPAADGDSTNGTASKSTSSNGGDAGDKVTIGLDPDGDFPTDSPRLADAPMATVRPIGDDSVVPPPPPPLSLDRAIMGNTVTDQAKYETAEELGFADVSDVEPVADDGDSEADALESELSSLRGLVDRLAGERDSVLSAVPDSPTEQAVSAVPEQQGSIEIELAAARSDLDTVRHELTLAHSDLAVVRQEREEAQRQHSDALMRQVALEKELAGVREKRAEVESQASEVQVTIIGLEDRLGRTESQLDETQREANIMKSQLETMTSERNQIREERIAIKAERDEFHKRLVEFEEKTGGIDIDELKASNKQLTADLGMATRDLKRVTKQADTFGEQLQTTSSTAESLKTENIDLTARLADTELLLETTQTQHEALRTDSEKQAAEVGSLRAERDGLQTQLNELQVSLSDVLSEQADTRQRSDADRQSLNELRVERDVLVARMNDLEQADRDYETKLAALTNERDDLVSARDELINERGQLRGEASAGAAERIQLMEKLEDAEVQIGPLETELQSERRQREELASRLLELDDVAERNAADIQSLTTERDGLAKAVEDLQAERVTVADIRFERDDIAGRLADIEGRYESETTADRERIEELTEQLSVSDNARSTLEQQFAETHSQLDTVRAENEEITKEASRLRVNVETLTEAVGEAKNRAADAAANVTEVEARIVETESKASDAEQIAAEAEIKIAAAEARIAELETQALESESKAAEAEGRAAEARRSAIEAEKLVADAEGKADQLVSGAESKVADTESKIAEVEARAVETEAMAADAETRAAEAQSKAADAERLMAEAEARAAEAESKALRLEADVAEVESRAARLEADVAEAEATALEAESKLANAEAGAEEAAAEAERVRAKVEEAERLAADAEAKAVEAERAVGDAEAKAAKAESEAEKAQAEAEKTQKSAWRDAEARLEAEIESVDDDDKPLSKSGAASPFALAPKHGDRAVSSDETATFEIDLPPAPDAPYGEDDGDSFAWPPPADDDRTIRSITSPPPSELDVLEAGRDNDDDDLDELSDLISRTVAGFDSEDGTPLPEPVAGADRSPFSAPPSVFGDGEDDLSDDLVAATQRRQIEIPADILDDELAVAQYVVSSPDVVLLVDGDSVAKLGWPSLTVPEQRDALVAYLADLSASSGAAPDVVFDGRIGDEALPTSRAVRIRLSTPPIEPAAALHELVDAYPDQWPIALVTDDDSLAGSAAERGATVLNNGQLLDLFIAE